MNGTNGESRQLIDKLIAFLTGKKRSTRFLVIENELPQTNSLHVTVIWSDWHTVDVGRRGRLIMEAYERTGRGQNRRITLALGLTPREALDLGLLPLRVQLNHRRTDPVARKDLVHALAHAVDGVLIRTEAGPELRLPSEDRALDVYRDLSERFPGPYWSMVQDVPTAA